MPDRGLAAALAGALGGAVKVQDRKRERGEELADRDSEFQQLLQRIKLEAELRQVIQRQADLAAGQRNADTIAGAGARNAATNQTSLANTGFLEAGRAQRHEETQAGMNRRPQEAFARQLQLEAAQLAGRAGEGSAASLGDSPESLLDAIAALTAPAQEADLARQVQAYADRGFGGGQPEADGATESTRRVVEGAVRSQLQRERDGLRKWRSDLNAQVMGRAGKGAPPDSVLSGLGEEAIRKSRRLDQLSDDTRFEEMVQSGFEQKMEIIMGGRPEPAGSAARLDSFSAFEQQLIEDAIAALATNTNSPEQIEERMAGMGRIGASRAAEIMRFVKGQLGVD